MHFTAIFPFLVQVDDQAQSTLCGNPCNASECSANFSRRLGLGGGHVGIGDVGIRLRRMPEIRCDSKSLALSWTVIRDSHSFIRGLGLELVMWYAGMPCRHGHMLAKCWSVSIVKDRARTHPTDSFNHSRFNGCLVSLRSLAISVFVKKGYNFSFSIFESVRGDSA